MANTLESLVPRLLTQGLMALRENAVVARTVNRAYDQMAGMKGSTIDVPIPSALQVRDVTPSNIQPQAQDSAPTHVPIALNRWKEVDFFLTDKEEMEVMEGFLPMQASEAIKALANEVDTYLLGLGSKAYGYTFQETAADGTSTVNFDGTPNVGAIPGPLTPFIDGTTKIATDLRKVLNNQLAPMTDRWAVIDPDAEAAALNIRAFQDASYSGTTAGLVEGQINRKFGFQWIMDQNVPTHVAGTAAGFLVNNAAGLAVGANTADIDAGTGVFAVGDVVTFAGHTQTYVVTAATATQLTFEPGIQAAVADNAVITSAPSHALNLGYHRDAMALATRPLSSGGSELGSMIASAVDPISGLSLRLEVTRQHRQRKFAYDILYGGETIRRELMSRMAG